MKRMSQIVRRQLRLLSSNQELEATVDAVQWKPGNRVRIILELDIHEDHVVLHGYEFRYRNPVVKPIPGSEWTNED